MLKKPSKKFQYQRRIVRSCGGPVWCCYSPRWHVPLLAVQVPPLTDYPNHLARCYVLAFADSDPVLGRMFSTHWQIIPNIAMDLILPPLMHVFPPFTAGRIALFLCFFVPVSGAIALSYAYFRRRSLWHLTPGFAAFNALFLMGFMNFEIAIGIAMWGAAAWIRYREQSPWAAIASGLVVAPLVFFFHLTGFFFYALLVGCHELFAILDGGLRQPDGLINAVKRASLAAIPFLAPACLYLFSSLNKLSSAPIWGSRSTRAWSLLIPFLDYSLIFDLLVIAPVIGFLAWCVITARVDVSRPGLLAAAILAHRFPRAAHFDQERMVGQYANDCHAGLPGLCRVSATRPKFAATRHIRVRFRDFTARQDRLHHRCVDTFAAGCTRRAPGHRARRSGPSRAGCPGTEE